MQGSINELEGFINSLTKAIWCFYKIKKVLLVYFLICKSGKVMIPAYLSCEPPRKGD
jgi:hypothetical protein